MKFISVFSLAVLFCVACSNNDDDDNAALNNTDSYFMQQASYSNLAEVSAGNIASTRGTYDSIKIFGSMMVMDHTEAQSALDSLGTKLNVVLPTAADSAHQAMAAQLQSLSGNTFDTAYIGAQVRDHIATIALFQLELSDGNNQEIRNYANKYLPIIQMHLQDAQSIQQQVR